MTPRIAVLVSIGRNPVSGTPRCSRNDVLALDISCAIGADVTVLHAGDPALGGPAADALKDYLAYGAASVEVLPVPNGQDIVAALAERLGGFDLVLCGSRAEAGEFSGMLPYLLAGQLTIPVVSGAVDIAVTKGFAEILQLLPKGKRRLVRVRLPTIIAVHPMAPRRPRYAYARRVAGHIKSQPEPLQSVTTTMPLAPWHAEPAMRRPQKLRAAETKHGHARMLSAIAATSKGGTIITTGTAAEKARAILAYLRNHRLIDF
jgi:electron transfer flavoprotein beta subunit